MNFNFSHILEMFTGNTRLVVLVICLTASITAIAVVPITQAYFDSDSRSCSNVLEENQQLVNRIVEISALVREYSYMQSKEKEIGSEMIQHPEEEVFESRAFDAGALIEKNKDSIISRIDKLTNIKN